MLVDATEELQGIKNRFEFLKQMNDPFSMKLRADFMLSIPLIRKICYTEE